MPGHAARCDGRQGRVEAALPFEQDPSPCLPTPAEARARRDEAMSRTGHAAERVTPAFSERAAAVILHALADGPASGEALTIACRRAGIQPPKDDRAFGPVYMRLARAGYMKRVGTVPRLRGHSTAGGNVWRLVGGDFTWNRKGIAMPQLAKQTQAIARPLPVLVPLIQAEIAAGNRAGREPLHQRRGDAQRSPRTGGPLQVGRLAE